MDAGAVRNGFREVLDDVQHGGKHVTIERWKRPVAVLVPKDWYDRASALMERQARE